MNIQKDLYLKKEKEVIKDIILFFELPVFVILSFLSLFLPLKLFILLSFILISLLLCIEIRIKRLVPTTFSLLLLNTVFFVTYIIFNYENITPLISTCYYLTLFITHLILLLIKKPLTTFYSPNKGLDILHWNVSIVWTISTGLCFMMSLLLISDITSLLLPPIIIFLCFLYTIKVEFFYFNKRYKRQKEFEFDNILYKQVNTQKDDNNFYNLVSNQIWSTIILQQNRIILSRSHLEDVIRNSDKPFDKKSAKFVAYKDNTCIGSIYCIIYSPKTGLPIERDANIDLSKISKIGKIMEIGHFCIHNSFRNNTNLILALFKCVIDFAIEHDVIFIVVSSYENTTNIYTKIGFSFLSTESFNDTLIGVKINLLCYNLSKRIIYYEIIEDALVQKTKSILNQYLQERYYKRILLRNLFKKASYRQYNFEEGKLSLLINKKT